MKKVTASNFRNIEVGDELLINGLGCKVVKTYHDSEAIKVDKVFYCPRHYTDTTYLNAEDVRGEDLYQVFISKEEDEKIPEIIQKMLINVVETGTMAELKEAVDYFTEGVK